MSGPSTSRAAFSAAAFAELRAAAGEGQGEALRLLLADIDEDPDQPRTVFDAEDLAQLAASIREHGVLQPIVVRPPVDGRYRLAFGARRLRAARLAGLADIPAVIRRADPGDFAAQVIENRQRAHLSNSDLAAAIARLAADGRTGKQIATICALKDYEISAFRQAVNFPPELRARIDQGDIRALYDLYRQWRKTPDAVLAALPEADVFLTVTEARRIIGGITGTLLGSVVRDQPLLATEAPEPIREAATVPLAGPANNLPDSRVLHSAKPNTPKGHWRGEADAPPQTVAGPEAADPVQTPVFHVAAGDGAVGRLIVDRRAGRPGMALVAFATGVAEMNAADLRIVRVE